MILVKFLLKLFSYLLKKKVPIVDDDANDEKTGAVTPPVSPKPSIAIVIDPGHYKFTPGKRSPKLGSTQFFEYQGNRDIAKLVIRHLKSINIPFLVTTIDYKDGEFDSNETGRSEHYWNGKTYVEILSKRTERIKKFAANYDVVLLLSIHHNAARADIDNTWTSANGLELYYHYKNPELYNTAKSYYNIMKEEVRMSNRRYHPKPDNAIYKNGFHILREVPSNVKGFLFEFGFMNNLNDFHYMTDSDFPVSCASAIIRCVNKFLTKYGDI